MIKYLENEESFNEEIKKTILVDFYASWCGPCKMLGALLEDMESELKYDVLKVDTDKYPDIAIKYGVMSIPTLLMFKDGELINKHIGYMNKDEIKKFMEV